MWWAIGLATDAGADDGAALGSRWDPVFWVRADHTSATWLAGRAPHSKLFMPSASSVSGAIADQSEPVIGTINSDSRDRRAASSKVAPRFHAFRVDELPHEAALPFLIQDIVPAGAIAEIHGAPGVGKSFVSIAMALSVTCDLPFLGHQVARGPVLYVAAERFLGLRRRIEAWSSRHGATDLSRLRIMQDGPQLIDAASMRTFLRTVERLPECPSLVVIDTFSRCLVGADENGQRDMTKVVESIDNVRKATGATILLVHHTRKGGDIERGSTVLRGAADLMIAVKGGEDITIHADKVNDFAPFLDIRVRLESVGDSCVLTKCPEGEGGAREPLLSTRVSPKAKQALTVLAKHPQGLTISAWGRELAMPGATLGRLAKDRLAPGGLVTLGDGGKRYLVTDSGHALLG